MIKSLIFSFAVILALPTIADHIRHPGKQLAYGHCTTTCQYIGTQQICNTHCF